MYGWSMIDKTKLIPNVSKLVRINTNWGGCKVGNIVTFQKMVDNSRNIFVKEHMIQMNLDNFELYESNKKNHLPVWF